jgi:hypothetical protein
LGKSFRHRSQSIWPRWRRKKLSFFRESNTEQIPQQLIPMDYIWLGTERWDASCAADGWVRRKYSSTMAWQATVSVFNSWHIYLAVGLAVHMWLPHWHTLTLPLSPSVQLATYIHRFGKLHDEIRII